MAVSPAVRQRPAARSRPNPQRRLSARGRLPGRHAEDRPLSQGLPDASSSSPATSAPTGRTSPTWKSSSITSGPTRTCPSRAWTRSPTSSPSRTRPARPLPTISPSDGARYIVENVFEGAGRAGRVVSEPPAPASSSTYPMPGEDLAKAEVVAPFAPALLRLEGNPAERRYVEHLRFRNLSFTYSQFELPPGNSNDRQGSASVPAAITLRGARNCVFRAMPRSRIWATSPSRSWPDAQRITSCGTKSSNVAAGGFRVNGGTDRQLRPGTHPQQSHHRQLAPPLRRRITPPPSACC